VSSTNEPFALVTDWGTRPEIIVTNRPLRTKSAEALDALYQANDPPVIFRRGDLLTRVELNRDGSGRVVPLSEDHIRGHLTRVANFYRVIKRGEDERQYHVTPPRDIVRDILTAEGLAFPHLSGIISSPVMRPDGSVLASPGYDIDTSLFYLPPPGFSLPVIPAQPTQLEVAAAVNQLTDVFADFPYFDDASRANALGSLLTPVVRPMIRGSTPLGLYDAPDAGTGKGLHVEVVSIIATGGTAAVTTVPRSEEEMRKRITSMLIGGQSVVLFDNIEGLLQSPSLAAAITAPVWQDRLLGHNRQVTLESRVTWLATGNNIRLGGDLARRCYSIRLDARTPQPWRRTGFRYPDLVGYVRQRRAQLVAALLTLVRAWVAAGRPRSSVSLGSFQEWVDVVGGVLDLVGIKGFLGNLDRMYEQSDVETPQWSAFLVAWRGWFADRAVTASAVIDAMNGPEPGQTLLREVVPDEVSGVRPEQRTRALGTALAHRVDRRYGPLGLRIVRVGTEHRAVRWKAIEG
jgi:putative DNA primase/helicase